MTTTSRAIATMRALKTQLEARAGLAGVPVYTADPGALLPLEAIVMLGFDASQEWAAIGRSAKDETFRIPCSVYKALPGASETVVQEVQDRVAAIIAEIETQLRGDPTINGNVRVAAVVEEVLAQGFGDESRKAEATFQIECAARI